MFRFRNFIFMFCNPKIVGIYKKEKVKWKVVENKN